MYLLSRRSGWLRLGDEVSEALSRAIISNYPNWSDRHFFTGFGWNIVCFTDIRHSKSFFGWNLTPKSGSASVGGQVDALFRLRCPGIEKLKEFTD
jgi:hypothetical protein